MTGGFILTLFMTVPGNLKYYEVYLCAAIAAIPVFLLILLTRVDEGSSSGGVNLAAFKESLCTFFQDTPLRATAFVEMAIYFSLGHLKHFYLFF